MDSPDPASHISHVSVGENAVWALSRDRRVWFRNGIRAASCGESESLAKGSKWIEMVGELHMLSIGPGNQVRFFKNLAIFSPLTPLLLSGVCHNGRGPPDRLSHRRLPF